MSRRMFSSTIVDSDAFLDMSPSAQNLYFHLGMRADDDGFIGNPKKVLRMIGGNDDDIKLLLAKRFVLSFESGVIVIKHRLIHNLIRADLYKETLYKSEKATLGLNENGAYTELRDGISELKQIESPKWLKIRRKEERTESVPQTARRIGKDRIGKDRIEREPTPSQIAKSFFEGGKHYEDIREEMSTKVGQPILDEELKKFNLYWTEPNKSGTRVRWEQQNTFDVRRRLVNWFSKISQFRNKNRTVLI